jgi:hypothetical protein
LLPADDFKYHGSESGEIYMSKSNRVVSADNNALFHSEPTKATVIDCANRFIAANTSRYSGTNDVGSALPDMRESDASIAELRKLFAATSALVNSSRDALYQFLGSVYAVKRTNESNSAFNLEVLDLAKAKFSSVKLSAKNKNDVYWALLSLTMDCAKASLRSQYKKVLHSAEQSLVEPNVSAFREWLEKNGGVVKLLASLTSSNAANPSGKPASTPIASIRDGFVVDAEKSEVVDLNVDVNDHGFAVLLVYRDPTSLKVHRIADVSESGIVDAVLRNAHNNNSKF